jgi:hypothetical protein
MAKSTTVIKVEDLDIRFYEERETDFISLTDMAKRMNPRTEQVIQNWMRNRNTLEFLGLWEKLHNPNFNHLEFEVIRSRAGLNVFTMSVTEWTESTGAVGVKAKAGRYGGTFAHKDIAFEFGSWLSPAFKLLVLTEYQRLKEDEAERLNLDWSLKRQLAKANWHIHTEAVREHLVPMIDWNTKREAIYHANEADLLNLALFGVTAREWKLANPELKGNIRDYASTEQLLVLSNLQALNAKLLEWDSPKDQRLEILNKTAREQMEVILNTKAVEDIKNLQAQKGPDLAGLLP